MYPPIRVIVTNLTHSHHYITDYVKPDGALHSAYVILKNVYKSKHTLNQYHH